jgi:hypothetical protein
LLDTASLIVSVASVGQGIALIFFG